MKRKRLNFKQRDYITGELKNVGYVEMRNADEDEPEEMPDAEEQEETDDPEEEKETGAPLVFPPGADGEDRAGGRSGRPLFLWRYWRGGMGNR